MGPGPWPPRSHQLAGCRHSECGGESKHWHLQWEQETNRATISAVVNLSTGGIAFLARTVAALPFGSIRCLISKQCAGGVHPIQLWPQRDRASPAASGAGAGVAGRFYQRPSRRRWRWTEFSRGRLCQCIDNFLGTRIILTIAGQETETIIIRFIVRQTRRRGLQTMTATQTMIVSSRISISNNIRFYWYL